MTQKQQQQQQPPPAGTTATSMAGPVNDGVKAWEEANAKKRAREEQPAASSSSSAGAHKRVQVKKESSTGGLVDDKAPVKQEKASSASNVHREATPMPVPISQVNPAAGPSTTSQQQGAPASHQQHGVQAAPPHLYSFAAPPPPPPHAPSQPSAGHPEASLQHPYGQASTSYPPPPAHAGYPPHAWVHQQHPQASAPPTHPDPYFTSPRYQTARRHLDLINYVSAQIAIWRDEMTWYQRSFSDVARDSTWLPDRHAEVQDIAWRYQGATRRFELHVREAAQRALRELEGVVRVERWGG